MDQNIGELQVMVEKLSKEMDKETRKREQAVRDKDQAVEKLSVYAEVYEALKVSDP